MKKPYETPSLRVYGDIRDVTRSGSYSGALDAAYPKGTPSTKGLFS